MFEATPTFEMANPGLMGFATGEQALQQGIQNQYLPAQLYQHLLNSIYQNQIAKNEAQKTQFYAQNPGLTLAGLPQQYFLNQYMNGQQGAPQAGQASSPPSAVNVQGHIAVGATNQNYQYPKNQLPLTSQQIQRIGAAEQQFNNSGGASNNPPQQSGVNGSFPTDRFGQIQPLPPVSFQERLQNQLRYNNPLSPNEQAWQAAYTNQENANRQQWDEIQGDASNQAQNAAKILGYANQFNQAYNNMPEYLRGPLSELPGSEYLSPSAQTANNAAKNIMALLGPSLIGSSALHQPQLNYLSSVKLSPTLRSDAEKIAYTNTLGLIKRSEEYNDFASSARAQGIPPQFAQSLFARYSDENPPENSNNQKSWQDYLTDKAISDQVNSQNPGALSSSGIAIPDSAKASKNAFRQWVGNLSDAQKLALKAQMQGGG